MPADPSLPADPPPKKRRVYKKPATPRKMPTRTAETAAVARREAVESLGPEGLAQLIESAGRAAAEAPLPDLKGAAALRRLLLRTWDRKPR